MSPRCGAPKKMMPHTDWWSLGGKAKKGEDSTRTLQFETESQFKFASLTSLIIIHSRLCPMSIKGISNSYSTSWVFGDWTWKDDSVYLWFWSDELNFSGEVPCKACNTGLGLTMSHFRRVPICAIRELCRKIISQPHLTCVILPRRKRSACQAGNSNKTTIIRETWRKNVERLNLYSALGNPVPLFNGVRP